MTDPAQFSHLGCFNLEWEVFHGFFARLYFRERHRWETPTVGNKIHLIIMDKKEKNNCKQINERKYGLGNEGSR